MSKADTVGSGIGVNGALGVLFVALKLTKHIEWSWWWVTAPFWIPAAILLAFFLGCCIALEVIK